jgi:predicted ABC-type exoprotein transport system permease subunit
MFLEIFLPTAFGLMLSYWVSKEVGMFIFWLTKRRYAAIIAGVFVYIVGFPIVFLGSSAGSFGLLEAYQGKDAAEIYGLSMIIPMLLSGIVFWIAGTAYVVERIRTRINTLGI